MDSGDCEEDLGSSIRPYTSVALIAFCVTFKKYYDSDHRENIEELPRLKLVWHNSSIGNRTISPTKDLSDQTLVSSGDHAAAARENPAILPAVPKARHLL